MTPPVAIYPPDRDATKRRPVYYRAARRAQTLCRLSFRIIPSGSRVLPTYLIIGVQKGGTTSLLAYLNSHPEVLPPLVKEPHFFAFRFHYGVSFYRACFPLKTEVESLRATSRRTVHCGEASPDYVYDPRVPRRVKALLPEVKLILLLRDPIERAFSQYRHNQRARRETRSFEDAIAEELSRGPASCLEIRRSSAVSSQRHRHFCYLARGLYFEQIRDWQAAFSKEQMLILKSEDFFRNTAGEVEKVLCFLELRNWRPEQGFPPHNVGVKGSLDPRVRERLAEFYKLPNEQLYEHLGLNCELWPQNESSVSRAA